MKSNNYIYFGPAIRIYCHAEINNKLQTSKNVQIENNSNIMKKLKRLGKIGNVNELFEKIQEMKSFKNYIELHEEFNNTLILNIDSVKDHGLYMVEDDFNSVIISGNIEMRDVYEKFKKCMSYINDNAIYISEGSFDFMMKNKGDAFKKEINSNGMIKILNDNLTNEGYQFFYVLLKFRDH